ncbi:hypothetical protein ACFU3E_31500 [Streptomyces sp. NPDC057424]|uniref:hypothetical protein n=1 Tax=Streptomyces sp. NPDC057424 TaxID=3346127 RepID=UPI0036B3C872
MTTSTRTEPQRDPGTAPAARRREPPAPHEPAPAETGLFAARVRGRHRKPRPRKVLLTAGGLALAAGALSLLRLTSGPGTDAGTVEAGPRPDPVTSAPDDAAGTVATFPDAPDASPSSPTALGGPTPSPVTKGARPSPSATTRTPVTSTSAGPASTAIPDTPNSPAPAPAPAASRGRDAPRPAPAPTAPPSRTAPAPASTPEEPEEPHDPGLCVPVIGLCVDSPAGRR